MKKEVTFRASIPTTETAIKIHGQEGARMTLDIAECDLCDFLMLLPMRNKVLSVTVQESA
tara:strand:+ start:368 stop:547 length:180 start_codon:yes stop_codon:yes gene_type:complete